MPDGAGHDPRRPTFTNTTQSRQRPINHDRIFNAALSLPPLAILSLSVLVLSYALTQTTPGSPVWKARPAIQLSAISPPSSQITPDTPPTLSELLATVCDALDAANVTHWLLPGLGLLPPRDASSDGRFTPWQQGVDVGVFQCDVLDVILAQSTLQALGVVPVESYFGLRLFHILGHADERYDFRAPFVDVVYMRREDGFVVSHCCDCGRVSISACTKTTCGCMVCAMADEEAFPLADIRIEGVRRSVQGPASREMLMLPREVEGMHPEVLQV